MEKDVVLVLSAPDPPADAVLAELDRRRVRVALLAAARCAPPRRSVSASASGLYVFMSTTLRTRAVTP